MSEDEGIQNLPFNHGSQKEPAGLGDHSSTPLTARLVGEQQSKVALSVEVGNKGIGGKRDSSNLEITQVVTIDRYNKHYNV